MRLPSSPGYGIVETIGLALQNNTVHAVRHDTNLTRCALSCEHSRKELPNRLRQTDPWWCLQLVPQTIVWLADPIALHYPHTQQLQMQIKMRECMIDRLE